VCAARATAGPGFGFRMFSPPDCARPKHRTVVILLLLLLFSNYYSDRNTRRGDNAFSTRALSSGKYRSLYIQYNSLEYTIFCVVSRACIVFVGETTVCFIFLVFFCLFDKHCVQQKNSYHCLIILTVADCQRVRCPTCVADLLKLPFVAIY
jgi:hypothetical protein